MMQKIKTTMYNSEKEEEYNITGAKLLPNKKSLKKYMDNHQIIHIQIIKHT